MAQVKQEQAQTKQAKTEAAGAKVKPSYKHVPHSQKPKEVVAKRNARERRRVQAVNQAFYKLRKCVPIENRNKRVSKVKTLQRAIDYIRKLERILEADDEQVGEQAPEQAPSVAAGARRGRARQNGSANCDRRQAKEQPVGSDAREPQIMRQKRGRKPGSSAALKALSAGQAQNQQQQQQHQQQQQQQQHQQQQQQRHSLALTSNTSSNCPLTTSLNSSEPATQTAHAYYAPDNCQAAATVSGAYGAQHESGAQQAPANEQAPPAYYYAAHAVEQHQQQVDYAGYASLAVESAAGYQHHYSPHAQLYTQLPAHYALEYATTNSNAEQTAVAWRAHTTARGACPVERNGTVVASADSTTPRLAANPFGGRLSSPGSSPSSSSSALEGCQAAQSPAQVSGASCRTANQQQVNTAGYLAYAAPAAHLHVAASVDEGAATVCQASQRKSSANSSSLEPTAYLAAHYQPQSQQQQQQQFSNQVHQHQHHHNANIHHQHHYQAHQLHLSVAGDQQLAIGNAQLERPQETGCHANYANSLPL